jgi:CO/xanthine dehydrogenase FAD-binding subunit
VTDVLVPRSLDEALELRAARPDAIPVAGGTDLWVDVNAGRARPPAFLDLSRVGELAGWRHEDGRVVVGAGTTFARIAREPGAFVALAQAARSVGSPALRSRATIGGNLATASPAGDAIPVLLAYDAEVVAASAAAVRRLPLRDFLLGPKHTALRPDELIVAVEWRPAAGAGSFAKVGLRNAMVIAVASVCLQLDEDAHGVRLALGSVGPTVLRAGAAETFAESLSWEGLPRQALAEFGRLAAAAARPIDDVRGTAAYRRHAIEVLAPRLLAWALEDRRAA